MRISIADDIKSETIRYVWLDEDGQVVSPIHEHFGAALGFINDWQGRWERLEERLADEQALEPPSQSHYTIQRIQGRQEKMTRTGKPPSELHRVRVTVSLAPLSFAEQNLLAETFEAQA